jgi:RNA polymerase-binding transcription factor DksA
MAVTSDALRRRITESLADSEAQLSALRRQYDDIVAASRDSNADDEHDPEGTTIAFERQQVVALIAQAEHTRADLERSLLALDEGTYGVCGTCGRPIGAERLEARPNARTCIACAAASPRGNRYAGPATR